MSLVIFIFVFVAYRSVDTALVCLQKGCFLEPSPCFSSRLFTCLESERIHLFQQQQVSVACPPPRGQLSPRPLTSEACL